MNATQRKMLKRLLEVCNKLGGTLDHTATPPLKYIQRQKAHTDVAAVIYAVFLDSPQNETREDDIETGLEAIERLEVLAQK